MVLPIHSLKNDQTGTIVWIASPPATLSRLRSYGLIPGPSRHLHPKSGSRRCTCLPGQRFSHRPPGTDLPRDFCLSGIAVALFQQVLSADMLNPLDIQSPDHFCRQICCCRQIRTCTEIIMGMDISTRHTENQYRNGLACQTDLTCVGTAAPADRLLIADAIFFLLPLPHTG